MSIALIIPSLEPREALVEIVTKLRRSSEIGYNSPIIVIDDGSGEKYQPIFDLIKTDYNCIVLKHVINLGKGRALKTAFNYIMENYPDYGVVTFDSDGQHLAEDVIQCCAELTKSPNSLVLGCRTFNSKDVPLRSRLGNKLTKKVFSFLCGISVEDTQTGLRGIPNNYLRPLMNISGERFEYEMNMLIETKRHSIEIETFPISTIYIDDNETSHFNPLTDSLKIYSVFLKYIFASASSFVVDILLFAFFVSILKTSTEYYVVLATVFARIISSIFNYFINRKVVFEANNKTSSSLFKYVVLVITQMLVSGFLVYGMSKLIPGAEVIIKIIVDSVLFFINYSIQSKIIFK